MGFLSWLKGRRKPEDDRALEHGQDEEEEAPLPEGGIDAIRADQQATLTYGVTPEQAARIAKRRED